MSTSCRLVLVALLLSVPDIGRAQTPEIPESPPERPQPKAQPQAEQVDDSAEEEEVPPEPVRETRTTKPAATKVEPASSGAVKVGKRRSENLRLSNNLYGETGLVRVAAAEGSPQGIVRFSFGLDFFTTSNFFQEADDASRVGATLGISGAVHDYVELWLSTRAQSTHNAYTQPSLLQSQGDVRLGIKGFYPLADLISIGADLQLGLLSGIGETFFDFSATQIAIRALVTSDLAKTIPQVPLRFHLNAGIIVDNSKNLLTQDLFNSERFALEISDFNRFQVGLAVEAPFKYVTPYVEYQIEFPFGYLATPGVVLVANGLRAAQTVDPMARICTQETDASCARPAPQRAFPQHLTLGARITALQDFTFDAAVEIGLTPDVATGVVATPPYNVVLLAAYAFDPFHARGDSGPPISVPILIPEVAEVEKTPATGSVIGVVKSKEGKEVQGAIVSFDRSPPVATSAAGLFRSHEVEPGPIAVTVTRDGYETATAKADIVAGQAIEIAVNLVGSIKEGVIKGRIIDDKDKPISGINVSIIGPTNASAVTAEDGAFEAKVIAGRYSIEAVQEGYLKKARELDLKGGESATLDLVVRKRPKQAIAEISRNQIVVKQSVHFVTGEARLEPDAAAVLDNVVDLLVANKQIKKLRIEGHTDNVGADDANLTLSRDRAGAVVDYLVQQGIDRSRLEAEGYGSSRPIAPNLTRRGREQNRRVEFHIVQ